MKKTIKGLLLSIIAVICVLLAVISVGAETYYQYYGYTYIIINNLSISIAGWDNRSPELVIPDSIEKRDVVSIANNAFENNDVITSVDFSNVKSLNRIGIYAFSGCSELKSPVILPKTLSILSRAAFNKCTSIPEVSIPQYVTAVPEQCFNGCSSLSKVALSKGLVSIGRIAFANCTALEYVEIPKSVISIDDTAFYNDNIVLGVYKDTYALQYAEENQIDHIILDGDKTGDVNGDGVVDILDATEIQKYAAESTDFTTEQFELGDINKDGYCDVIDALLVQKSVIGAYELPQNIIRY